MASDAAAWGTAGMIAGCVARLAAQSPGRERALLNDALVLLQARQLGHAVLTANRRGFDSLQQLVADSQVLSHRPT